MSDYTVKREKEGINPSLVSSELTTIETFKDTTEKRGSKLTLNELNYISDKQLHQKTDGGEGGSSSPIKLANIVFHTPTQDEKHIDTYLKFIGSASVCAYTPAHEEFPALASALPDGTLDIPANAWNSGNMPIIVPAVFALTNGYPESFKLEITGDAEIMPIDAMNVLYVTGDCTITIKAKGSGE